MVAVGGLLRFCPWFGLWLTHAEATGFRRQPVPVYLAVAIDGMVEQLFGWRRTTVLFKGNTLRGAQDHSVTGIVIVGRVVIVPFTAKFHSIRVVVSGNGYKDGLEADRYLFVQISVVQVGVTIHTHIVRVRAHML